MDYLITHLTLALVLGTVAFGGSLVCRLLIHLPLRGMWAVMAGLVLFLVYLGFVGAVIMIVGGIGQRLLDRFKGGK